MSHDKDLTREDQSAVSAEMDCETNDNYHSFDTRMRNNDKIIDTKHRFHRTLEKLKRTFRKDWLQ
jgi:hypothetical protein